MLMWRCVNVDLTQSLTKCRSGQQLYMVKTVKDMIPTTPFNFGYLFSWNVVVVIVPSSNVQYGLK